MKVLAQWSQATSEDWREYDSAEWGGLPSKPLPVGGETMDAALGYVCAVNVQGVTFIGYDHYAVEDLPAGKCRLTVWKDDLEDAALDLTAGNVPSGLDPSQYGPADLLYARVWEFEPVARHDGRWNTLQRQTIYAGRAIRDYYAALGPVENTTIRPWEEFVQPPAAIVRYGVWMPDELMQAHEAAQRLHPWMEWAPEPVIPQGPEHHSITYLLNAPNTADSDCVPAVDHNNKMDEAGQTSEDLSSVFTGGQSKTAFAFTTLAGDPNVADWPAASAGDPWKFSINIVAAGADITYATGGTHQFWRPNSACTLQEQWGSSESPFTGTGVKVGTNTVKDPAAGAAGDRFMIQILANRAASHGSQTLTLRTDASSFAQGPWSVSDPQLVTPGTAALTLSTFAATVLTPVLATIAAAALTLATFAPIVTVGVNVVPTPAALTTSTFAPTVTATANQLVTPGVLALTTTNFAPTVTATANQTVTPATLALVLTTFAPTVTGDPELALGGPRKRMVMISRMRCRRC